VATLNRTKSFKLYERNKRYSHTFNDFAIEFYSFVAGTQSNHVFMAICAAFQLECLHLKHKLNDFALRSLLYIKALQQAMNKLDLLKAA